MLLRRLLPHPVFGPGLAGHVRSHPAEPTPAWDGPGNRVNGGYKETLDPGTPPERRIEALACDVTAGRFD